MTNLVIEITVPVTSDNVIEQAEVIGSFHEELKGLLEALPENATHTSRLVKERAAGAAPRGRKPKAAANGAEGRQQPSA